MAREKHGDLWNGVYEATKDFHLGGIQLNLKAGQLILVRGAKIEIEFVEYQNPDIHKLSKAGFVKKLNITEDQAKELWRDKIKNKDSQEKPKVPIATWRG